MECKAYKFKETQVDLILIGDIHIGDKACTEESITKLKGYIDYIKSHANAYCFLMGDIINNATLDSKSSPFQQNMDVTEQINKAVELFKPISKKILGAIGGNHENRMQRWCGYSPMISICERLGVPYMGDSAILLLRLCCHGNKFTPRATFTGYLHHCFDEKTELLTKSGWKMYNELKIGEEAATLNTPTGFMEWNKIKDVYQYNDFDEMVHLKTKSCDLVVSKDHTLINMSRENGEFIKKKANEFLNKEANLPANVINNNKEYAIDDDLLKILCWVLTEGTTFKGRNHEVRITQSDKPKVDHYYILDIINRLSKQYQAKINVRLKYKKGYDTKLNINRNYDAYEIYINRCELSKIIRELIPEKKIPKFFFNLSKRQFDLVLNELALGDGCFDNRYGSLLIGYDQKDKLEQDKLQALLAINGYRSVLSKSFDKRTNKIMYRMTITNRRSHRIKKEAIKIKPYKGIAWCVSLKNKSLIVRRNGKVTVTGNSTGGGDTTGGKINRPEKLKDIVSGCDFYATGHAHGLITSHGIVFRVNETTEKIEQLRQVVVTTGGYLQYRGSYAEEKMLRPLKIGSPKISLIVKRPEKNGVDTPQKDIHISL